jgi:hypothetical protein
VRRALQILVEVVTPGQEKGVKTGDGFTQLHNRNIGKPYHIK